MRARVPRTSPSRKNVPPLARVLALLLIFFVSGTLLAYAYEEDAHYVLTYYLARKVGYTEHQARQIASGDVGIDKEPNTEPLQLGEAVNPAGDAQTIRVRFHAFPDSRYFLLNSAPSSPEETHRVRDIRARESQLWTQALATGNPGIYLHYYQDVYAHAGYWSFKGHLVPGHTRDFMSDHPGNAESMMQATTAKLQEFMRAYLRREPCQPDAGELRRVLNLLIVANPSPNVVTTYVSTPDWKAARDIVIRELHENLPDWIGYHFDPEGNPKMADNRRTDPNWKLQEGNALEFLAGKWRSKNGEFIIVNYTPKEGEGDEFHVELSGKVDWKGVYRPRTGWWYFNRKPTVEEMSSELPEWVRKKVEGKLEWRMFLRMDRCKLVGKYYPGYAKWDAIKNEETGEVDLEKSKASVPDGEAGWGKPKEVEYEWYGHP